MEQSPEQRREEFVLVLTTDLVSEVRRENGHERLLNAIGLCLFRRITSVATRGTHTRANEFFADIRQQVAEFAQDESGQMLIYIGIYEEVSRRIVDRLKTQHKAS